MAYHLSPTDRKWGRGTAQVAVHHLRHAHTRVWCCCPLRCVSPPGRGVVHGQRVAHAPPRVLVRALLAVHPHGSGAGPPVRHLILRVKAGRGMERADGAGLLGESCMKLPRGEVGRAAQRGAGNGSWESGVFLSAVRDNAQSPHSCVARPVLQALCMKTCGDGGGHERDASPPPPRFPPLL